MRKLTIALIMFALGWSGWWWAASSALRGGIDAWLTARVAEGWQAEASDITGGGYPLTVRAGLRGLALADPEAGLAVRMDTLDISAPAWWPGDVTVALDDGPIALATPFGQSDLTMDRGVMALNLHPGTALQLEALTWTAGPWAVRDRDAGLLMAADTLQLTMGQVDGPTYRYLAEAKDFSPGDATRRDLQLPSGLPDSFESLVLSGTITFDRPWDRRALDQSRPQPRRIEVERAEAHWGEMRLHLAADLNVDETGEADGTVALRAENWQTILDVAETSGQLPSGLRDQAERVLGALAGASGNPQTIDATLTLRGGGIYLGFIPLAEAPRFILR